MSWSWRHHPSQRGVYVFSGTSMVDGMVSFDPPIPNVEAVMAGFRDVLDRFAPLGRCPLCADDTRDGICATCRAEHAGADT
jgi:hypothetical protein